MKKSTKNPFKKIALTLSLFLLFFWMFLGTGTSLAWFTDTDEEIRNIFHFAEFDLDVEYRDELGNWKTIEGSSELFDDEALYEPGYTQVVYLRIKNNGNVPFDYKTAVIVTDYTEPINMFGQKFLLQEYLKFGLTVANSEQEMDERVKTRELAAAYATEKLSNYYIDDAELKAQETVYMAVVVHMPESVNNIANYRGDTIPRVELGITVTATQKTK